MDELEEKGAKIEGNKLIIEFDPASEDLSKTGRSYVLSSSKGFVWLDDVGISWNVIKRLDRNKEQ